LLSLIQIFARPGNIAMTEIKSEMPVEVFVIVRCPACRQRVSSTVTIETHDDGPNGFHCPHCYNEIVYEAPHFASLAVAKGDWKLVAE